MNKKEMARKLRKEISKVIKNLPDVEYKNISLFQDVTTESSFDLESAYGGSVNNRTGTIYSIEIGIEEVRDAD